MIEKIIKNILKNCLKNFMYYSVLKGMRCCFLSGLCFFYVYSTNPIEISTKYFNYSKKLITFVITQKTLANATYVIKFIYNRYQLNYIDFKPLRHIKLFKHPLVINCLYNIESTNSLEPIFFLWDAKGLFASQLFLYEYAMLVFLVYRDTLLYLDYAIQSSMTTKQYIITYLLSQTTELYNKIERLPLDEIIMIVNLLSEELPSLIEDQTGEPIVSWYAWFKKHWLKFSVGIFTLLIKIIIIFKNGQNESIMQGYNMPTPCIQQLAILPEDILRTIKPKRQLHKPDSVSLTV